MDILRKNDVIWYCRIISAVMIGTFGLWLGCSLLLYCVYGITGIFMPHAPALCAFFNRMSMRCAHSLFSMFGIAVWVLPLVCVYLLSIIVEYVVCRWEQLVSAIMTPFVTAALLHYYTVDNQLHTTSGGFIGWYGVSVLTKLFSFEEVVIVALHAAIMICVTILFVHKAAFLVRCAHDGTIHAYRLMIAHDIPQRILTIISYAVYYTMIYPALYVARFITDVRNGSYYQNAGLMVPEDHDKNVQDITLLRKRTANKQSAYASAHNATSQEAEYESVSPAYIESYVTLQDHKLYSEPISSVAVPRDHTKPSHDYQDASYMLSGAVYNDTYVLPPLHLFNPLPTSLVHEKGLQQELDERAQLLATKLERFGIMGNVGAIKRGPVVTLFEYQPHMDTKLSKIIGLEDDLAMALQALSIRIIAPIPGRSVVGFEVANTKRLDVLFASIIAHTNRSALLPLVLGHDTVGAQVVVDLARMPHLLIAGSTGSGKSVALNGMLISLLCSLSPSQLRLVLIDPKRLEFMTYADIGHLVFPIITDPKAAINALKWVVQEMEERYKKMAACGARNLIDYNERNTQAPLPFIVVVIDELSDLMLTVGRDIEDLITRITQMARASGIHMIVATQRPSVDVITGLIKVNFPSRISFRVTSRIDSRTILDCNGAERLLGRGDMLFLDAVNAQLKRVHGALVTTQEIERVVEHIRAQGAPIYLDTTAYMRTDVDDEEPEDELYEQVMQFLQDTDDISISLLQRKFRIGYNRSARIIDRLELHGIIMPPDGSKTRKVIK